MLSNEMPTLIDSVISKHSIQFVFTPYLCVYSTQYVNKVRKWSWHRRMLIISEQNETADHDD